MSCNPLVVLPASPPWQKVQWSAYRNIRKLQFDVGSGLRRTAAAGVAPLRSHFDPVLTRVQSDVPEGTFVINALLDDHTIVLTRSRGWRRSAAASGCRPPTGPPTAPPARSAGHGRTPSQAAGHALCEPETKIVMSACACAAASVGARTGGPTIAKGVRVAQKMQVGPCIPVGMQR